MLPRGATTHFGKKFRLKCHWGMPRGPRLCVKGLFFVGRVSGGARDARYRWCFWFGLLTIAHQLVLNHGLLLFPVVHFRSMAPAGNKRKNLVSECTYGSYSLNISWILAFTVFPIPMDKEVIKAEATFSFKPLG